MHRLNSLRWAALPVGLFVTLSITQCVDSLSDDCTKTLTCGTESQVTLDNRCQWRYPDGGIWTGGPTQDPVTRRWKWPDGTETETQDFRCAPDGAGGADAGADEPDCTVFGCDSPRQCDEPSRRCVECLDDTACAANVPMGDAGAAGVCDTLRKACVRCVDQDDCASPTPVCKVIAEDTDRSECVECTVDEQCGDAEPVCDTSSNECTLRCTGAEPEECSGSPDKSVCNTERRLCVECVTDATCTDAAATQCNTTSNECVQCVDNGPCAPLNQVCDETSNRCVQCETNDECAGVDGKPVCDTETNLCVACLGHGDCTQPNASRCNIAAHECALCTDTIQCEGGAVCNTATGACVQCTDNSQCTMLGANTQCELTSGTCVQCTDSSQCMAADAARCETAPGAANRFRCVGCTDNPECGKLNALCRTSNGVCVECLELAGCSDDASNSFCSSGGACVPCAIDAHCAAVTGLNACLVAGGDARCVECVDSQDCVGKMGRPACKTTNSGAATGPGNINECVECVSNADCTNPSASKCVGNACVPCTANADCAQPGLGVCDLSGGADGGAAQCVQCTGTQFQACANGANVCNSLTRQCTNFAVGSADGNCDPCVSDAHCDTDTRCVQETVGSTGYFCFPVNSPTCNSVPFSVLTTGTIDNGSQTACTLRRTSCAAFLDFDSQSCDADTDCGLPDVADGICTSAGARGDFCSLPCTGASDCAGGACAGGVCEL